MADEVKAPATSTDAVRQNLRQEVREQGGEAACQLHRVCTECGRMNELADGGSCEACGAALPEG
ncbi:hypothetical protein ABZW18_11980 [Streptomyces sp. NPDC004647]|uniref:hypothetical protein n=1 Tax=Streptomyces sp. NPDC004647 TaxID=3154671 RepID=UPI0033B778F5